MAWGLSLLLAVFAFGWFGRRLRWLQPAHGDRLLQLVVRVGLPVLIFASVSGLPWVRELLWLPLIGALLVVLMWPIAWLVARRAGLPRARRGVLVTGPMIMNLAFVYPMVVAWGADGAVARLALIDFGNGALGFTLVYGLAGWYGGGHGAVTASVRRVLRFPPFWALGLGVLANLLQWPLPAWLIDALAGLGGGFMLLVPLALGIYFRPSAGEGGAVALGIGLRAGVGVLLGIACVWWFPLDPLSRAMVLAAAAAPIGFNTLVFAARAGLDRELAANMASLSVLLGFVLVPVVLWWFLPVGV